MVFPIIVEFLLIFPTILQKNQFLKIFINYKYCRVYNNYNNLK